MSSRAERPSLFRFREKALPCFIIQDLVFFSMNEPIMIMTGLRPENVNFDQKLLLRHVFTQLTISSIRQS